jgi:hypothetical protein
VFQQVLCFLMLSENLTLDALSFVSLVCEQSLNTKQLCNFYFKWYILLLCLTYHLFSGCLLYLSKYCGVKNDVGL